MNYYVLTKNQIKMKPIYNNLLFAICFFTFSSLLSQETVSQEVGVFDFELEEIDYGTINQHDNGLRTFKFTNKGKTPIIIADIKTSCGCTVPKTSNKTILPGETGEIDIEYDTKRIGAFSKTITVLSNASEKRKLLTIKGKVLKKSSIN